MDNNEKNTVCTVFDNGPIMIKGNFKMLDAKGKEISVPDTAFLCRCGHSKNKPFCDGMHKGSDFKG